MQRMLVTTDGSPESETIIPIAAEIARAMNMEVHLLRVEHVPATAAAGRRAPNPTYRTFRDPLLRASSLPAERMQPAETRGQAFERAEHEVLEYLEGLAKSFEGLQVHCNVAFNGDAGDAVIHVAKDLRVDLIAMATHGRSSVASLVQGSVASKVVHSGVAPVLLARPSALRF